MSDLVTRNGKMYKQVPCYDDQGELFSFVLVEVASGPAVPPESIFEEPETPVQEATLEEDIVDSMEETTALEVAETPAVEEPSETPVQVVESITEELIVDSMTMQKTVEDTDVLAYSDDEDAASSSGSTSIDRTDDSDSELEDKVVEKRREQLYLVFSTLDAYHFDDELRTSDGMYLTNVDGKHVFEFADISEMYYDGVMRRLHFRETQSKVQRKKHDPTAVCFKPLYKTLKKVQVRSGPGSKFEATGVIGANEEVIVIQEGLMQCDLKLVEDWMKLHLPKEIAQSFRRSKAPTFENYIKRQFPSEEELDSDTDTWTYGEPIETYINQMFDEDEEKIFRKALAAANRKVRVMYKENGTTKYGWISKRKNSGALITRVWGKSTPSIVVSGVETQPNDTDLAFPENCAGTMLIDTMNFMNSNKKNTTVKFTNQNGKKSERVESHCAKPTMSFYQKLAKSEISTLIGTKKPRFNIEWESKFRSDRFRGLEKHTVMVDGKSRMRTGYFVPEEEFTVTFQRLSDAVTFYNACLRDTRFERANVEWNQAFANLQTVDAKACPEYHQFKFEIKGKTNRNFIENKEFQYGIAHMTL
jgi:hypothetical protein